MLELVLWAKKLMSAIDLVFKIAFKIKTRKPNKVVSLVRLSLKQQFLRGDFL